MPRPPNASRVTLASLTGALALGCGMPVLAAAPPPPKGPVILSVDATDAPRRVLRAHLSMPARPGPLTLLYPKWIPGEHGPTGPIVDLTGLRITAGGVPVPWRRDSEQMYELHLTVPPGASALEIDLESVESAAGGATAGGSSTLHLADVSWNRVLLYPRGAPAAALTYVARLRLPPGWRYGTALPVAGEKDGAVEFQPASLVTLVDSPVVAGEHFRSIDLGQRHRIDLVSDSVEALEMTRQQIAAYRQLVAEAGALFGARHYRGYRFLYTLSNHVAHFGLEHHESSDNRSSERTLIEDDLRRLEATLLPHELVHSWNGKYRRPKGLATPDYQQPMRGDLLWVYEGLTSYLGLVLAGRSGLVGEEDARAEIAGLAATLDHRPGRLWRPLADTAISAQTLYGSPDAFRGARRGTDFYGEGVLIWLEVDVAIRNATGGQRSLDDFCRLFHGGADSGPEVRPYDLDDVVRALSTVAPGDWRGFFAARVSQVAPRAPVGGIVEGGYRLAYEREPSSMTRALQHAEGIHDLRFSLGFTADTGGLVGDVVPGSLAARAGLAPGRRVVAVDGRRFSGSALEEALARARGSTAPIELLVEGGEFFTTLRVDWHEGPRYPHLVRDPGKPDRIAAILAPRTPRPPEAVAPPRPVTD